MIPSLVTTAHLQSDEPCAVSIKPVIGLPLPAPEPSEQADLKLLKEATQFTFCVALYFSM